MFGTVMYPEQFSPHEIRVMNIPFSASAEAFFHCCRSARWFAPYFARVKGVATYGFHWYTAFSTDPDRYKMVWPKAMNGKSIYCFGCPGKKSHGLFASLRKYAGLMKAERLTKFSPVSVEIDTTYDPIAELYHDAFFDIKVRSDEFNWIRKHFPQTAPRVLDIGCGNGALLREFSGKIKEGVGVDISGGLIARAQNASKAYPNLKFEKIDGPALPFADGSFDLVISMLSFRYLDWDPIMKEIERVLSKGGKLVVIDMVTAPVKWKEVFQFLSDKVLGYYRRMKDPAFYAKLKKLVEHPDWHRMLQFNPIRAEHELKWYLESRFPGRRVEVINIGYNSRILAFDSVNMDNLVTINLTYP